MVGIIPPDWIYSVQVKKSYYEALACYYQGLVSWENGQYDEHVRSGGGRLAHDFEPVCTGRRLTCVYAYMPFLYCHIVLGLWAFICSWRQPRHWNKPSLFART